MTTDHERSFFRVPCEFQIRYRIVNDEETQFFKSHSLKPSPFATIRSEIETQIQSLSIREESRALFERGFQILINLDQRLERIEETLQQLVSGSKDDSQHYELVSGDLGAGGLSFKAEKKAPLQVGNKVLVDLILPSMPEYRVVAVAEVARIQEGMAALEFVALHEDDKEFIHHFVSAREREILRARALEREKNKSPS